MTIRRDEVEPWVLTALEEKLLRQDLFAEFCEEFSGEMNRLRGQHRATPIWRLKLGRQSVAIQRLLRTDVVGPADHARGRKDRFVAIRKSRA